MTVLEATVDIIKSVLLAPNNTGTSPIINSNQRLELTKTIEEVYKKLEELEKDKKTTVSHQF